MRISPLFLLIIGLAFVSQSSAQVTPTSQDVLSSILSAQGVTDKAQLDCAVVTSDEATAYGEAFFTEQIDTSSPEYATLMEKFPSDKRDEIFMGMGLQNLGCATTVMPTPDAFFGMSGTGALPRAQVEARAMEGERSSPLGAQQMSFIAAWTTIVWMFSALGFAVFMVWVTSSTFRLRFRKMAEGDFEMNDKAMTILKERFARGEVTKEQFDKMRRDILN